MSGARDRITSDPKVMNGQPCLRGLRLTVQRVVRIAAQFPDAATRAQQYPELEDEDVRQALDFAAACMDDQVIELPARHEAVA